MEAKKKLLSVFSVNRNGILIDIGLPHNNKMLSAEHFNQDLNTVKIDGEEFSINIAKIVTGMSDQGFVLV